MSRVSRRLLERGGGVPSNNISLETATAEANSNSENKNKMPQQTTVRRITEEELQAYHDDCEELVKEYKAIDCLIPSKGGRRVFRPGEIVWRIRVLLGKEGSARSKFRPAYQEDLIKPEAKVLAELFVVKESNSKSKLAVLIALYKGESDASAKNIPTVKAPRRELFAFQRILKHADMVVKAVKESYGSEQTDYFRQLDCQVSTAKEHMMKTEKLYPNADPLVCLAMNNIERRAYCSQVNKESEDIKESQSPEEPTEIVVPCDDSQKNENSDRLYIKKIDPELVLNFISSRECCLRLSQVIQGRIEASIRHWTVSRGCPVGMLRLAEIGHTEIVEEKNNFYKEAMDKLGKFYDQHKDGFQNSVLDSVDVSEKYFRERYSYYVLLPEAVLYFIQRYDISRPSRNGLKRRRKIMQYKTAEDRMLWPTLHSMKTNTKLKIHKKSSNVVKI